MTFITVTRCKATERCLPMALHTTLTPACDYAWLLASEDAEDGETGYQHCVWDSNGTLRTIVECDGEQTALRGC